MAQFEQFEGLTPSEIDALENEAYRCVFQAQTPEEADAARGDVHLIGQFILRSAIDG